MDMKRVLSIAGTDPTGGAGMQADIKTITAHKMFAMSVVTALVAQNTMGVYGVIDTPPEFVGQQMDCVMTDIFPDAVKIGMVSSAPLIEVIADRIMKGRLLFYVGDHCPTFAESYNILSANCSSQSPAIHLTEEDDAAIYFSSGTTGFPKAILHNHQSARPPTTTSSSASRPSTTPAPRCTGWAASWKGARRCS